MLTKDDFDFNIWHNTNDPDFIEINIKSHANPQWLLFGKVYQGKYANSILKPINRYAEKLYTPPELVEIKDGIVRLRQVNHADFFLLDNAVKEKKTEEDFAKPDEYYFKHLDRPHVRQYYNSSLPHDLPKDCFPGIYLFYVPWILDEDIVASIEQPKDVESPFIVYGAQHKMIKLSKNTHVINPTMIPFHFKRIGSHMVDKDFGKILRGSPMYDIVFEANDIIIERIKEFYANN